MGKSDANRTGLAYAVETTWGTIATRQYQELRFTGESLAYNVANIQSSEIRDDRQIADTIQTGADCGGGFNFELSYGSFDDLLYAALWSSGWSVAINSTKSSLQMNTAGHMWLDTGQSFASFVTGQWIEVSGFAAAGATADNNNYFYITGARTTGIDVIPPPTVATASSNNSLLTVKGSYIRNGVTETSLTIEREHADITQFFAFAGMVANTLNITATANAVLTGSIDFIGKSATRSASAGTSTANASATTTDVLNTVSNVGRILEGATAATMATIDATLFIQEISFSLNNNVRGIPAIGTLGFVDIGVGSCEVTGALNVYFKDGTLYDKYIAGTETGLAFKVEDEDGNAYIFTFPRIKFESDAINASGQNTDIMENMAWRAIRDVGSDCMIQIDKFPA